MLPKQENYELARRLALENLRRADLRERAACGGGIYRREPEGEERIRIPYLGRDLSLFFPGGTAEAAPGPPLSLREEIFLLHYLENASGSPLTGEWISFAEIPGGAFYHPVFLQRAKAPLVKFFGEDPQKLLAFASEEFEGEPWDRGDTGVVIRAFPRVRLGMVLWKGDAEFSPEGNVLFDSCVTGYLPVEDIVILAETVIWKLIKRLNMSSPPGDKSPPRKEP